VGRRLSSTSVWLTFHGSVLLNLVRAASFPVWFCMLHATTIYDLSIKYMCLAYPSDTGYARIDEVVMRYAKSRVLDLDLPE
jgi:hypothetical protein